MDPAYGSVSVRWLVLAVEYLRCWSRTVVYGRGVPKEAGGGRVVRLTRLARVRGPVGGERW